MLAEGAHRGGGEGAYRELPHSTTLFFLGLISETRVGGAYMYSNIRAINRRKWGHHRGRRVIQEPDQR